MSFWQTASLERKLAQLDAGIELGMTSKQIAMNCRAPSAAAIRYFAMRNGRRIGRDGAEMARKRKISGKIAHHSHLRRLYERAGFDQSNTSTARIFDNHVSGNLFDPHPFDEEVSFA